MATVLLVDPALAAMADRFAAGLPPDVRVAAVPDFSEAALRQHASGVTVLVNARRPIDQGTLSVFPDVKFIQMIGAGTDALDGPALAAAGVVAAYNPGVNSTGAAEHVILLMLALVKRLPSSMRATVAGRFAPGEIISSGIGDIAGATVGIVGMGHIGRAVAERLVPFGARIAYQARRPITDVEERLGAVRLSLEDLLRQSDIVSLHVPLLPETYHLIGASEIALMRRGSWLINAGRGGLVDEAALREAIASGHVAGAGLDVLEDETRGLNSFADMPEVLVTPHLGGGSRRSIDATIERSTANIRRFLAGEQPLDLVPVAL